MIVIFYSFLVTLTQVPMSIGPKPVWDSTGAEAQELILRVWQSVKAGNSGRGSEVAQQSMVRPVGSRWLRCVAIQSVTACVDAARPRLEKGKLHRLAPSWLHQERILKWSSRTLFVSCCQVWYGCAGLATTQCPAPQIHICFSKRLEINTLKATSDTDSDTLPGRHICSYACRQYGKTLVCPNLDRFDHCDLRPLWSWSGLRPVILVTPQNVSWLVQGESKQVFVQGPNFTYIKLNSIIISIY